MDAPENVIRPEIESPESVQLLDVLTREGVDAGLVPVLEEILFGPRAVAEDVGRKRLPMGEHRSERRAGSRAPHHDPVDGDKGFDVTHKRALVGGQQLLDAVWGTDFYGDDSVVATYISYLRRKVDLDGLEPLIHTHRGFGYVLRGERH